MITLFIHAYLTANLTISRNLRDITSYNASVREILCIFAELLEDERQNRHIRI